MPDEIEQIGGMREKDIRSLCDRLGDRIGSLEKIICANGRPGLEDRMRTELMGELREMRNYVDKQDVHKQKNGEQALLNVQALLEFKLTRLADSADAAESLAQTRHDENKTSAKETGNKVDSLALKFAFATGATAVIELAIMHFWK